LSAEECQAAIARIDQHEARNLTGYSIPSADRLLIPSVNVETCPDSTTTS
jgi:hypothetical protein